MPIANRATTVRGKLRRPIIRPKAATPAARLTDLLGDFSEQTGALFG